MDHPLVLQVFGWIFAILLGYLVGSVPCSLLVAKFFNVGDIRLMGSGNVGATNVLRNSNWFIGFIALALDASKGIIACVAVQYLPYVSNLGLEAGLAAVIGHIYSPWLGYSGGKGVATLLGVIIAFNPYLAFSTLSAWVGIFYLFGYSSVASVSSLMCAGFLSLAFFPLASAAQLVLIIGLVIYKHKDNLKRFVDGKEQPLILYKKKP